MARTFLAVFYVALMVALFLLLLSWLPAPGDTNYAPSPAECGYYGCP